MRLGGCLREAEVKELLDRGSWREACAAELRIHVEDCRVCRDLVLVTQAFRNERARASAVARLESPGALWWRAQLRRRNAAIERIGRPILGAQIFAAFVLLLAATVFLASQASRGLGWLAWLEALPQSLHLGALLPDALQKSGSGAWLVVSLVGMLAVLGGVIVYVTSERRDPGPSSK